MIRLPAILYPMEALRSRSFAAQIPIHAVQTILICLINTRTSWTTLVAHAPATCLLYSRPHAWSLRCSITGKIYGVVPILSQQASTIACRLWLAHPFRFHHSMQRNV